jgi:hypothetical protein
VEALIATTQVAFAGMCAAVNANMHFVLRDDHPWNRRNARRTS